MKQWLLPVVGAIGLGASAAQAGAQPTYTVTVEVRNVRVAKGHVHIDLCREQEFLKDCPIQAETRAVAGTTIVVARNVPPGDYGVQATLDENDNHRVDRGLFGIPKEGVGFSNDAPIRLGPPHWRDAVFSVRGDTRIVLSLRYFGGSGR